MIPEGKELLVGDRIRAVRSAAGLTQQALADKAGVKKALLGQWETGRRHPVVESLRILADALECSFLWLALGLGDPWDSERPNGPLFEACVELAITTWGPNDAPRRALELYRSACKAGIGLRRAPRADHLMALQALADT
jgi:transcriptional regulator with XRE-family HTH domain